MLPPSLPSLLPRSLGGSSALAPAVADTQACYNWVKRAPSKTNNETFYFKPGFGPKPPGAPKLFPATSEHIRVVVSATERLSLGCVPLTSMLPAVMQGRTARSSAASSSLHFDWSSTTIVAKMTGPASILLNESSNATSPSDNPRHGETLVPAERL